MQCHTPGTINEDDLLRYTLDPQDLSSEASQHFDTCPVCRARADEYKIMSTALARKLYRWDCPTTLKISEYAAGLLTGKDRKEIEAHLKRCTHCAEEVAISQEFLDTPEPALPQRPRIKATLVQQHHLLEAQRAMSVRGENIWPRQYTIDGISLSLHLAPPSPPGKGTALIGLISRLDISQATLEGVEIHLLPTSITDQQVPPAVKIKLNNFMFQDIPPGSYELLIVLPEGSVLIEDLELRL